MQFLPATWREYGLGGNIEDPHDAILGAANYLAASGAPGDYFGALQKCNPSVLYANAVLRIARAICVTLRSAPCTLSPSLAAPKLAEEMPTELIFHWGRTGASA